MQRLRPSMPGETCLGNTRRTLRKSTDRKDLKAMRVPNNYVYFVPTKTVNDNTRKLRIKD